MPLITEIVDEETRNVPPKKSVEEKTQKLLIEEVKSSEESTSIKIEEVDSKDAGDNNDSNDAPVKDVKDNKEDQGYKWSGDNRNKRCDEELQRDFDRQKREIERKKQEEEERMKNYPR